MNAQVCQIAIVKNSTNYTLGYEAAGKGWTTTGKRNLGENLESQSRNRSSLYVVQDPANRKSNQKN